MWCALWALPWPPCLPVRASTSTRPRLSGDDRTASIQRLSSPPATSTASHRLWAQGPPQAREVDENFPKTSAAGVGPATTVIGATCHGRASDMVLRFMGALQNYQSVPQTVVWTVTVRLRSGVPYRCEALRSDRTINHKEVRPRARKTQVNFTARLRKRRRGESCSPRHTFSLLNLYDLTGLATRATI
jgi:hypothetical protein